MCPRPQQVGSAFARRSGSESRSPFRRAAAPIGAAARQPRTDAACVLSELGWMMRNPGHGHPLRPEYLLTPEGARIAASASMIAATQTQLGLAPGSLTRRGMPLVRTIGSSQARFNEFTRALAAETPRALSQGLQTLSMNDLVAREVVESPPATRYRLTPAGFLLTEAGGLVVSDQ